MFTESNRIIVVDDKDEDLFLISKEFNRKGIGCRTIKYDGLEFPDNPLIGIRIAFFDINLSSSNDDNQRFSVLQDAICKYISKDNGPYVLIFWTSDTGWKDKFIDYVNRDKSESNVLRTCLKPFYVSTIDKRAISDTNPLEQMLCNEFSKKMVELCLDFDRQLLLSSSMTINKLLSIIPIDEEWGRPVFFEEKFKNLFSKIAIESMGRENAIQNPSQAINDAIVPIINASLPRTNIWNDYLNLKEITIEKEKSLVEIDAIYKLNAFFFIDNNISFGRRGCVVELKESVVEEFTNRKFIEWKKEEFGESDSIKSVVPIAIEISPACDDSQANPRNLKYILGIASKTSTIKIKKKDNTISINPFYYKNNVYQIALNFNYVAVNISEEKIETVLFNLKKEIMDMIGNRYANHISRIGITSFR